MDEQILLAGLDNLNLNEQNFSDFYLNVEASLYADYDLNAFVIIIKDRFYNPEYIPEEWCFFCDVLFECYYNKGLYQTEMRYLTAPELAPWINDFCNMVDIYNMQDNFSLLRTGYIEFPHDTNVLTHVIGSTINWLHDPYTKSITWSPLIIIQR